MKTHPIPHGEAARAPYLVAIVGGLIALGTAILAAFEMRDRLHLLDVDWINLHIGMRTGIDSETSWSEILATLIAMYIGALAFGAFLVVVAKHRGLRTGFMEEIPLKEACFGLLGLGLFATLKYLDQGLWVVLVPLAAMIFGILMFLEGEDKLVKQTRTAVVLLTIALVATGYSYASPLLVAAGVVAGAAGIYLTRLPALQAEHTHADELLSGLASGPVRVVPEEAD